MSTGTWSKTAEKEGPKGLNESHTQASYSTRHGLTGVIFFVCCDFRDEKNSVGREVGNLSLSFIIVRAEMLKEHARIGSL